ncbi:MAG: diaminopimelate epimerase [Acetobacteraceae bacterium]|nr:diaminopimelate epimerase [Acetobacteraceae bacterium]
MRVPFIKMHGAGNDFVIVDERAGAVDFSEEQVRLLADRRRGIGCDQFITLHPPPAHTDADLLMRIRNPDGSEAGACGNATRCVAEMLFEQNGRPYQVIRTVAGDLPAERLADGRVRVDLGRARLGWADVPLAEPSDTLHLLLPGDPAACSVGNPHVTFFVDDVDRVEQEGAAFERHALFPDRVNVGYAKIIDRAHMRLRVWERGAGLTLACGSGASAAAVNAHRRGLIERHVAIEMDGGTLEIDLPENGRVLMTGPVAMSFRGEIGL